jgi:hypothetical protein
MLLVQDEEDGLEHGGRARKARFVTDIAVLAPLQLNDA